MFNYVTTMITLVKGEINPTTRSSSVLGFFRSQSADVPRLATASLLPSGKVRAGWIPAPKVSQSDRVYEHQRIHTEDDFASYKSDLTGRYYCYRFSREVVPPLGLSAVPNCHKLPRKHGLKGITSQGRENVKESAFLLERVYRKRLGFYTLTCPYTDAESIHSYNQNISYILRSYFQELKREYDRKNCTWSYVSVLEWQTARFDDTGFPVLHIHYIAPCYLPSSRSFIVDANKIRSLWRTAVRNVVGKDCNTSASVDSQVVSKSAAGYLAKYMSKGGDSFEFLAQNAPDQFPSQWWSTSRNLRKALKDCTVILPLHISHDILSGMAFETDHPAYLQYHKYIYVQWKEIDICVGISAQMSTNMVANWQDFRGKLGEL